MAKNGLVLEGGAMRGIYTAGVIDVFLENGIKFDLTIGVSAGACFGCNIKSEQPGRALRYNLRFCRDKRYCSFRELLRSGDIYGYDFCYHKIPERLDAFDTEKYRSNPSEFYVVATDLKTGKPVYKKLEKMDRSDMEWVRASASMPVVSNTVKIGRDRLLDGGISDSIPVEAAFDLGCEKAVVVLTRPAGYEKKQDPLLPIEKIRYKNYPKFIEALEGRKDMYNNELAVVEKLEKEGKVFVIRPSEEPVASRIEHDPQKLLSTYNLGHEDATDLLPALKRFL
jgi:predicted patatin/cPLA2 family phospholipase